MANDQSAFRVLPPEFARDLHEAATPQERLQRGVELIAGQVDGCDSAGVSVVTSGQVSTPAATNDVARRGDALQYELGEGPCLDSVRRQSTVISDDIAADGRWPRWAPRAAQDLGVGSMMCLLLYTHDRSYGALNLYSTEAGGWAPDDVVLAHVLAEQLAVAFEDAVQIEHRGRAMASRTVIGQAQGILMERFGVTADQAFAYLRRSSQDSNRKLVAVAVELVDTRRLPSESPVPATSTAPHAVSPTLS